MGSLKDPMRRDAADSGPRPVVGPTRAPRTIRRIVVCLDGSQLSELCIPDAIQLARTFKSKLTLLTVLRPRLDAGAQLSVDALDWEIAKHEAEAYLGRIEHAIKHTSDLPTETRVEQGHPAERIVALSRELGADLTVLGSHGESGLTEWALGSTARQVLAELRGSVFVGRSTPRRTQPDGAPSRILVPLDGTPRTESVLPTAACIASARGAELLLTHVVQEPLATVMLASEEDQALAHKLAERLETSASRYLEHLRTQLAREGTAVRALVLRQTDVLASLLDLIPREGVDLVVLSAHGATCNPAHPFGSVTGHLLAHSTAPVLVLQDLTTSELDRSIWSRKALDAPTLRASFAPGDD